MTPTWQIASELSLLIPVFLLADTLLPSGMVLIEGGTGAGNTILASGELYNPATGVFAMTGSMVNARSVHSATLLPNGLVLIAAGDSTTSIYASAELYH